MHNLATMYQLELESFSKHLLHTHCILVCDGVIIIPFLCKFLIVLTEKPEFCIRKTVILSLCKFHWEKIAKTSLLG